MAGRRLVSTESKDCPECGVAFSRAPRSGVDRWKTRTHCSLRCAALSRSSLVAVVCPCGRIFQPERNGRAFCSRTCASRSKNSKAGKPARYRKITTPDGRRMLEHRYRMEISIGRRLKPFEQVHHKNGDKKCNEDDNLELWVRAQPGGQRISDLVAFVVGEYPDLVKAELLRRIGI